MRKFRRKLPFGIIQRAREANRYLTLLVQTGFPFIRNSGVLHGMERKFESLFQRLSQRHQTMLPPSGGFLIQTMGAGFAKGLMEPVRHLALRGSAGGPAET